MLLTLIKDKQEILKLHNDFVRLLNKNSRKKINNFRLTTPGTGTWHTTAQYNPSNNIWSVVEPHENKKDNFYILLGVDPDPKAINGIVVQCNYQIGFENFKEACFWANDSKGKVYLLHSGRMGGGVKGINFENIDDLYSGARSTLLYNDVSYDYFTVCELHSKQAYQQVVDFVNEVDRIKCILKSNTAVSSLGKRKINKAFKIYSPEFWGKRKSYFIKKKISSNSKHGFIVDGLEKIMHKEYGVNKNQLVKNKYIDLGITKNNKAVAIFEIKPSINTQSIYTAIGQLMLHSSSIKSNPAIYIVLPNKLEDKMEKDLLSLSIKSIRFVLRKNKVRFINLNKFF
ncbi:MAG: hypothetical protein HY841_14160 [Bacteroidetes bacterium]|nr:hypothetical protein [Bacteroidota bacterium]